MTMPGKTGSSGPPDPKPGPAPGPAAGAQPGPAPSQVRSTPLRAAHERLGATMITFAGWLMPVRYASETAEHRAVRGAAGLFDLSHMGEILVSGPGAGEALDFALAGHLSALAPGRARYTMLCAADGGILDDLIVYRLSDTEFLVVANAANTATVAATLAERATGHDARCRDATADYALIAIQGPNATGILARLTPAPLGDLRYYASYPADVAGQPVLLARTGYTGEDGFEIFAHPDGAEHLWSALLETGGDDGLVPAGLAARDTLRLEAGMPLYGNELGPDVTPFDAGLGRVVAFGKPGDFVGRAALAARAETPPPRALAGLVAASRRVPRHGYPVAWDGQRCGTVTSGAPSPTLGSPIAMAYLDRGTAEQAQAEQAQEGGAPGRLTVDVRGTPEPVTLTGLPFYRRKERS